MEVKRQGDITGYDDAEVVDRKEYMKIKHCEKCAMNGSGSKYCDNCRHKMKSEE